MTSGMTLKRIGILLCSISNVEPFDCKNFSSFSEILQLLLVALYLITLKMAYLLLNAKLGIYISIANFTIRLMTNLTFLNTNVVRAEECIEMNFCALIELELQMFIRKNGRSQRANCVHIPHL